MRPGLLDRAPALVEALVPARLGRDYRWLLASSWVAALGDGIALASGPLLVASLTPCRRCWWRGTT